MPLPSIGYGALYTTMSRLNDVGWVEQTDSEDEDGRLRCFRITGDGIKAMSAMASDIFYCPCAKGGLQ
jgi:DNA-binding PadR family transcriptional regulator